MTPEIAAALYVGLVTDTGRFMYENTDARTHRVAAALIDAGVDVDDTYRRLYEHVPLEKLRLVARALGQDRAPLRRQRSSSTYITGRGLRGDRRRRGDDRGDHRPPALGRGRQGGGAWSATSGTRGRAARKVSLRSSDGDVDVSAIARKQGGGGHVRAAGFSTDLALRGAGRVPLRRGRGQLCA